MFNTTLLLKYVPVFSEFDDTIISKIEKLGVIRNYNKDAVIIDRSSPGTGLFIINKGKVKVTEKEP
ncbi:MAG: hypothetical protein P8X47_09990, partial [Ignavibacteriaceae bacterium]